MSIYLVLNVIQFIEIYKYQCKSFDSFRPKKVLNTNMQIPFEGTFYHFLLKEQNSSLDYAERTVMLTKPWNVLRNVLNTTPNVVFHDVSFNPLYEFSDQKENRKLQSNSMTLNQ